MRLVMLLLLWVPIAVYIAWETWLCRYDDCVSECPACLCELGSCRGHKSGFCPLCLGQAGVLSARW